MREKITNFDDALKFLNIEDYFYEIVKSSSQGELSHLNDYINIANIINEDHNFRGWFINIVEQANNNWKRPQSVYQYMLKLVLEN